jgi:hypothetical protein
VLLLKEVRSICIIYLYSFEFNFAPRSCDIVAHSLAQYGLHSEIDCVGWEGEERDFVSVLVASDLMHNLISGKAISTSK